MQLARLSWATQVIGAELFPNPVPTHDKYIRFVSLHVNEETIFCSFRTMTNSNCPDHIHPCKK
uniref:Uncharacterized protein n=1 Tax=Arundo donax TaxID=35708 RepID=A0A0A9HX65_ARUDO